MNLSIEPVHLALSQLLILSFDASFLFMGTCARDTVSMHALLFEFIDTRMLIFARHLTFATPFVGSSDSPESSCSGFGVWSLWILPVTDQSVAAETWISGRSSEALSFQAPCSALEFSCYDSEPPFVLFIIVYLFVFSHLRLWMM